MARLNKACFKINLFGIDRGWKRALFEEIREYVCKNYPDDVCVVDIDMTKATIVMRTTKVIRQEIVDKFDMEYLGSRTAGWLA